MVPTRRGERHLSPCCGRDDRRSAPARRRRRCRTRSSARSRRPRAGATTRRAARLRVSRRLRSCGTSRRACAGPRVVVGVAERGIAGGRELTVRAPRCSRSIPARRLLAFSREEVLGQRLVEHERAEVEVALRELLAELLGLAERRALERGDDRERRAAIVQQLLDRLAPRSTKPGYMDWKFRKNSAMSWRNWLPRMRSAT